jgi:TolB-like protein
MIPDSPSKKKRHKVRSAWISFAGRIVAHVIGAIASVVLGLMVLDRYSNRITSETPVTPETEHAARPRHVPSDELAIAVLPLQNYSADAKQAYIADGITDALITDLAHIQRLRVTSRTSSMAYKDTPKAIPAIARELGVDLILEGSIVREGDRVRVTAQLIDADTDHHLWARSYDRTSRDVLRLQAELVTAIGRDVSAAISARLGLLARAGL